MAEALFREADQQRLEQRLLSVTAGDLTPEEVGRLAGGDLEVARELPATAQRAVKALLKEKPGGQLEKMVGVALDFVPVAYLDLGRMAANAVARVVDRARHGIGTGTLISRHLFLTNNHVIPSAEIAADRLLQFNYELEVEGTPRVPVEFALDSATFFLDEL